MRDFLYALPAVTGYYVRREWIEASAFASAGVGGLVPGRAGRLQAGSEHRHPGRDGVRCSARTADRHAPPPRRGARRPGLLHRRGREGARPGRNPRDAAGDREPHRGDRAAGVDRRSPPRGTHARFAADAAVSGSAPARGPRSDGFGSRRRRPLRGARGRAGMVRRLLEGALRDDGLAAATFGRRMLARHRAMYEEWLRDPNGHDAQGTARSTRVSSA